MTRRIKRTRDYELSLVINNDEFIPAPRKAQRDWLLNRATKEFADELEHLNELAKTFVPGVDGGGGLENRTERTLSDLEIMEDWQIPIMQSMSDIVTRSHGDVLEIGFGRGVASGFIQAGKVNSHTIIECNPSIIKRFNTWRSGYSNVDIRIVEGMWQNVIGKLGTYDGIFFHTYPLNEQEFVEQVVQSSTFAEHFFAVASKHLNPHGVFTYLTNESDSLSRPHQRALLKHFRTFKMSLVSNLAVPHNTQDAMWADSMVIVEATQ